MDEENGNSRDDFESLEDNMKQVYDSQLISECFRIDAECKDSIRLIFAYLPCLHVSFTGLDNRSIATIDSTDSQCYGRTIGSVRSQLHSIIVVVVVVDKESECSTR